MKIVRLTLGTALMTGVSTLAVAPAIAKPCEEVCIPPMPALCDVEGSDLRDCGPLRDNSAVETAKTQPNQEAVSTGLPAGMPAFRISVDGVSTDLTAPALEVDAMRRADVAATAVTVSPSQEKPAHTQVQADTLHAQPMLSIAASSAATRPGTPVTFFTFTNYARYVDMAEVLIFRAEDNIGGAPYARIRTKAGEPAIWIPSDKDEGEFRYSLRVYAPSGRFDETMGHPLLVTRAQVTDNQDQRTGPVFENQREVANIPVNGSMITVSGSDLPMGAKVELFGSEVAVSDEGKFVTQQIVPDGVDTVRYSVTGVDGTREVIERPVDLPKDDDFLVAIADITAGHRSWNNREAVEALQGERADLRRDYVDGRLAFYYKAKLNSRYRLTASADTGEHPLSDLFDQFGKKDPRSLLRRLDPDRHYPVYGDDSTTVEDAPTYGRFYVRAESENAEAMWGNFQTQLTGTDLIQYSRGLYGGKLGWQSMSTTSFGDKRAELTGFAADPGTIGGREELSSTGGSVYFLRRRDLTQGSERVAVEVRDRDSGIVLERRELSPATDYEVNYLQGRLLLRSAVPITASANQIVRNSSLAGNPVYVVVNYEYSPGLTTPSTLTLGGRGQLWLGNHVRFGATGYHQGEDQEDQDLYGTDVLLRYKPGTYLRGEFARSKGEGTATSLSGSGGYTFTDLRAAGGKADAFTVEAAADLAELGAGRGRIGTYWRQRDAGFSGPGVLTGDQGQQQFGATVDVALGQHTTLVGKADLTNSTSNDTRSLEAGLTHNFGEHFFAKLGVRTDNRAEPTLLALPANKVADRTDGAVTIGYRSSGHIDRASEAASTVATGPDGQLRQDVAGAGDGKDVAHPWSIYAFGQTTLKGSASRRDNKRYGLGGDVQIDQRTRLNAEVSEGTSGIGASAGVEYAVNERGSMSLNYALTAENPDGYNTGRLGRVSATSRYRFTDAVSVFAEGRYDHGNGPTGLTQGYGVDFAPAKDLSLGLRYDRGSLSDPVSGGVRRQAIGATVDYTQGIARLSSALEYRTDRSVGSNRSAWATRNSLTLKPNEDWRVYGKANLSFTKGEQQSEGLNANYYEFVTAAAYRPVANDRLNVLAKFTYLYDRPTQDQVGGFSYNIGFAQRSRVVAIDATYQLTPMLAIGGKFAQRVGQLRSTTEVGAQWFSSKADFFAVRADLRVVKEWDALVELRRLSVRETKDARFGLLAGVYRHLGNHVKLGVGYNFSDYSDDLTNLSNKERGFFFNIVGKY